MAFASDDLPDYSDLDISDSGMAYTPDASVLDTVDDTPRGQKPRPSELGLLDLPPEIREQIFRMMFEAPDTLDEMPTIFIEVPAPGNWNMKGADRPAGSNILFTCHSAFLEALSHLYAAIYFVVDISSQTGRFWSTGIGDPAYLSMTVPHSFRFDLVRHIDFLAPRNSSSHASLEDAFKRLSWGKHLNHLTLRIRKVRREYSWDPWTWRVRDYEPLWEKMKTPYPALFMHDDSDLDFGEEGNFYRDCEQRRYKNALERAGPRAQVVPPEQHWHLLHKAWMGEEE